MQTKIDCTNGVVTVTCGNCGEAPCGEEAPVVKPARTRRPITDNLVAEWATNWHAGRTFAAIAENYGYALTVVSFNVYKHLAFMQAGQLRELEEIIRDLRAQNKKLREKNKELN